MSSTMRLCNMDLGLEGVMVGAEQRHCLERATGVGATVAGHESLTG